MNIRAISSSDLGKQLQEQVNDLFGQLNPKLAPLDIRTVLEAENPATILSCWEHDKLLGMACMATYKVVSGHKGWIEDVVVRESSRGQGIGRALLEGLLATGREKGLSEILLFTGNTRLAAIALYEKQGFRQKNSRLYTYSITQAQ